MDVLILVWAFQAGQSSTVIENIHTIIAAAAVKFSFDQLSHLFVLIQKVSAISVTEVLIASLDRAQSVY